jgi:hypothetical protein
MNRKKSVFLQHIKNQSNVKNIRFILVLSCFILVFNTCSTKVDLYAEYKDVPIIYAMLNPRADTNFVKITRAFCGTNDNPINANEVALIADSCNYPVKLDARIIELKNTHGGAYEPTGRVMLLDTITLHNKEEGTFYAPDQTIYYTTEPFNTGSEDNRYKYRLVVLKPDGDTVTALTSIVGNEEFAIMTGGVKFQVAPTEAVGSIYFRADGMAPLYEITMQFNYREQRAGQEMKCKNISRSFGTKSLSEYAHVVGNTYKQEYSMNWLFNTLANTIGGDTIVNANHPDVVRYIDDFIITISAGGEELSIYYLANQAQAESPTSLVTTYTNIEGGYGLFSSRTKIETVAKLSANTKRELFGISSWGFKEQ